VIMMASVNGMEGAPPYSNGLDYLGNFTLTGDLTVTGALIVTGSFTFGDAAVDILTVKGRINVTGMPASYLLPAIGVGVYGTPIVDTTLVDYIFASVNISSATNKTVADSSQMALYIGNKNTADTIHNKLQGVLVSTTVAFDVFDAYGVQSNFAITDDMATHDGNANLVAGAFKISIKDSKTATGNVSSIYVVTGDTDATTGTTATGTFDAIRFENNSTALISFLNFGGCTGADFVASFDAAAGCVTEAFTGNNAFAQNNKGSFTQTGQLIIKVAGATRYIPYGTVA
jgi:hypothetical protein